MPQPHYVFHIEIMKFRIINLVFIFFSCGCFSQATTGIISYGEIQSLSLGAPIGQDYNAFLVFNETKSLYITRKDSLESLNIIGQKEVRTADGGASFAVSTNKEGFQYFFDKDKDSVYSRDIGFKYVKDKAPSINWNITNETKKIGRFTVQKALTRFRGRNYTVWYAPQIPLPYGPWKLQGLPGIIIEAYNSDKSIFWYFKSIEYPTDRSYLLKPIYKPKEKVWITFDQFKNFLIQKYKDAVIAGRMVAEKMNIKTHPSSMANSYIEVFDAKDEKK